MIKIYESAVDDQLRNSYDLDDVDGALTRYTLNPMYSVSSVFDDAVERYGNEEPITVYRGLNFATKEEYTSFMNSIKDGKIKNDDCSSWSPNKNEAETFAITRPSYMEFMDADNMKLISKQHKEAERITGYRGVLLQTRIKPHTGIDLRRTDFAKETEIILGAGTYKVKVVDVLSYKDMIDESSIDDIIYSLRNKREECKSFINYVMKNFDPDDVSDETKDVIFKVLNPNVSDVGKYRAEYVDNGPRWGTDSEYIDAYFHTISPSDWFNSNKNNLIINKSKKTFKKFLDEVFDLYEKYKYEVRIKWEFDVNKVADRLGLGDYLTKKMKVIGKRYNDYNDTAVRDINKIKDPEEKDKAIRDYTDNILKMLKSMGAGD